MEATYFLFGTDACQELLHEGEDALIDLAIETGEFDIYKFVRGTSSPIDLLRQYDGWSEFTVISQELYIKLLNI